MAEKNDNKNRTAIIGFFVVVLVSLFVLIVFWFFTNGKTTHISEQTEYGSISSLVCKNDHSDGAFFSSESVQRYTHTVTVMFMGGSLSDMSYNYEGIYRTASFAEADMARMHAKYNKYMGEVDVYSESLNPIFSTDETKVKISLYAELKKLSRVTLPLFFLSKDDHDGLDKLDADSLKKKFENSGFSCTFRE